jgi:hypothetical protein
MFDFSVTRSGSSEVASTTDSCGFPLRHEKIGTSDARCVHDDRICLAGLQDTKDHGLSKGGLRCIDVSHLEALPEPQPQPSQVIGVGLDNVLHAGHNA